MYIKHNVGQKVECSFLGGVQAKVVII